MWSYLCIATINNARLIYFKVDSAVIYFITSVTIFSAGSACLFVSFLPENEGHEHIVMSNHFYNVENLAAGYLCDSNDLRVSTSYYTHNRKHAHVCYF